MAAPLLSMAAAVGILTSDKVTPPPMAYCEKMTLTTQNLLDVDVVIIGGGIAGSSLAYHLSKSKSPLSVALLDSSSCGSQATGLSAGTFWSGGHSAHLSSAASSSTSHSPPRDPDFFDPICEINAFTAELYAEVQQAGFPCGLDCCGNLMLACTEQQRALIVAKHAQLLRQGYNVLLLCSPEAVWEVEPALRGGNSVAALWTLESGFVEPLLACRSIADAASSRSGSASTTLVREDERVTAIIPSCSADEQRGHSGERIEVRTARGNTFRARHVVVAAGVASPALLQPLGAKVPVYPVQGTMMLFPPASDGCEDDDCRQASSGAAEGAGVIKHTIYLTEAKVYWQNYFRSTPQTTVDALAPRCPPRNCSHDYSGRQVTRNCYGRPVSSNDEEIGGVLFGGSRIPLPLPGGEAEGAGTKELQPCQSNMRSVYNHVLEFYPRIAAMAGLNPSAEDEKDDELGEGGAWVGVMPFSQDGRPLVGSLEPLGPHFRGLWMAGGYGPEGIMQAPGSTRFLAEELMAALQTKDEKEERDIGGRFATGDVHTAVMQLQDPCRVGGVTLMETQQAAKEGGTAN